MKRLKKALVIFLFLLPEIIGVIGYMMAEQTFFDSLYGAACLYFFGPIFDEVNILIGIARWLAPLATASGILMALQGILRRIRNWFRSFCKDATVVYAEAGNSYAAELADSCKHGILAENDEEETAFYSDAAEQILLFPTDQENLAFYKAHKEQLDKKKVYMKLDQMDSFLLKENKVHFFNTNEIVASDFWKAENLTPEYQKYLLDKKQASSQGKSEESPFTLDIAIIGFDIIGQKLLDYAILYNIYGLNQKITYHIFGDSEAYQNLRSNMDLMNGDSIVYYEEEWHEKLDVLERCNRVIVTVNDDYSVLEGVLYACPESKVYAYSSEKIGYNDLYQFANLIEFGDVSALYTEENIKMEKRLQKAKQLNYGYACKYNTEHKDIEQEWAILDGFTKASNLASANYHVIRQMILTSTNAPKKERDLTAQEYDELGRLEHIRWCRFHYLNHWKHGELEGGKNKDLTRRIHTCLIPYDELSTEDQQKDIEAVKVLMEILSDEPNDQKRSHKKK